MGRERRKVRGHGRRRSHHKMYHQTSNPHVNTGFYYHYPPPPDFSIPPPSMYHSVCNPYGYRSENHHNPFTPESNYHPNDEPFPSGSTGFNTYENQSVYHNTPDSHIRPQIMDTTDYSFDQELDTTPSLPLVDRADDEQPVHLSSATGTDGQRETLESPVSSTLSTVRKPSPVGSTSDRVNKKLINKLTRMDKHNLKHMIHNPDSKYASALQTQARRRNRVEMRKQLRMIGSIDTGETGGPELIPDECVDGSAMPSDIIEQIGRMLNVDMFDKNPDRNNIAGGNIKPNNHIYFSSPDQPNFDDTEPESVQCEVEQSTPSTFVTVETKSKKSDNSPSTEKKRTKTPAFSSAPTSSTENTLYNHPTQITAQAVNTSPRSIAKNKHHLTDHVPSSTDNVPLSNELVLESNTKCNLSDNVLSTNDRKRTDSQTLNNSDTANESQINTSNENMQIASELLDCGWYLPTANNEISKSTKIPYFQRKFKVLKVPEGLVVPDRHRMIELEYLNFRNTQEVLECLFANQTQAYWLSVLRRMSFEFRTDLLFGRIDGYPVEVLEQLRHVAIRKLFRSELSPSLHEFMRIPVDEPPMMNDTTPGTTASACETSDICKVLFHKVHVMRTWLENNTTNLQRRTALRAMGAKLRIRLLSGRIYKIPTHLVEEMRVIARKYLPNNKERQTWEIQCGSALNSLRVGRFRGTAGMYGTMPLVRNNKNDCPVDDPELTPSIRKVEVPSSGKGKECHNSRTIELQDNTQEMREITATPVVLHSLNDYEGNDPSATDQRCTHADSNTPELPVQGPPVDMRPIEPPAKRVTTKPNPEIRHSLRNVPKQILSVISRRLRELNADAGSPDAKRPRTDSVKSNSLEPLSQDLDTWDDVIDVTPADPSVDLTEEPDPNEEVVDGRPTVLAKEVINVDDITDATKTVESDSSDVEEIVATPATQSQSTVDPIGAGETDDSSADRIDATPSTKSATTKCFSDRLNEPAPNSSEVERTVAAATGTILVDAAVDVQIAPQPKTKSSRKKANKKVPPSTDSCSNTSESTPTASEDLTRENNSEEASAKPSDTSIGGVEPPETPSVICHSTIAHTTINQPLECNRLDAILKGMKDIDDQMLKYQTKKMRIDALILRRQQEKMAIDRSVMRLQNERVLLLNALLDAQDRLKYQQQPDVASVVTQSPDSSPVVSCRSKKPRRLDSTDSADSADDAYRRRVGAPTTFDANELPINLTEFKHVLEQRPQVALANGIFHGHAQPLAFMQVIEKYLVAVDDDGNLYQFVYATGELLRTVEAHANGPIIRFVQTADNEMLCLYRDGCLRTINFDQRLDDALMMGQVGEPLEVVEYNRNSVFLGADSGKVYAFDLLTMRLAAEHLFNLNKSIVAMQSTRHHAAPNVLIVAARSSNIQVRDANTGSLIRILEMRPGTTVHSLQLDGDRIHCATSYNHVLSYEIATGIRVGDLELTHQSVRVRLFGSRVLLSSSAVTNTIFAVDRQTGKFVCRVLGGLRAISNSFEIIQNKIIFSATNQSTVILPLPEILLDYDSAE